MEEKKKPIWMQILIFILAMSVCLGLYFGMRANLEKLKEKRSARINDDFKSCFYQLDMVKNDKNTNKVRFEGFYFRLNQDTPTLDKKSDLCILLVNTENPKEVHSFSVKNRIERRDIEEYFKCEYVYLYSGIVTEYKEIDLKGKTYEVLLKEKRLEWSAIETGLYVHDGQLVRYNPKTFQNPNVVGTELEKIVKDGYLMAYRPDMDVWVYQYAWNLYWIVGKNYCFEEDGSTYIQFQMNTTQVEHLPEERLLHGWDTSNIGDDFEKHEVTEKMGVEGYRVSVREMPVDYSVSHIWTGYHLDSWVWRDDFRPVLK